MGVDPYGTENGRRENLGRPARQTSHLRHRIGGIEMITLTREEAQQVLDVLNDVRYRIEFGQMNLSDDTDAALETLRVRLAQPEPELKEKNI
jgi:hypothetical protein